MTLFSTLRSLVLTAAVLAPTSVLAQEVQPGTAPERATAGTSGASFYLGPLLSTTGIGITGHAQFTPRFSAGLDLSFLPLPDLDTRYAGEDVTMETAVRSAVLMGYYHPKETSLVLGVGAYLGGHRFEFDGTPSRNVDIGDGTYTPAQIDRLVGEFVIMDGPALLLEVGSRGEGYVTGFGLGFPSGSSVTLGATGPIRDDERFQRDAAQEIENVRDFAEAWPVVVYARFGYQFGL